MKKSENVAGVVSRGFKSYFPFAQIPLRGLYFEEQIFKAIHVVLYGKHIVQNLAVGVCDKAVMLVLCNIDSDINHNRYLAVCLFDAVRIHRALYVL